MTRLNQFLNLLLLFIALMSSGMVFAQLETVNASEISIVFNEDDVEFKSNEIVSNPAQIINISNASVRFTLEASIPPAWNALSSSDRVYELAAGDSMYIPFRLVPKGKLTGNTKYSINVILRTEEGLPLTVGSFFCFTKKIVKWEMSVLPEDKIYFRNDENTSEFQLSLLNIGNYEQDFQLSLNGGQREDLLLMDSAENVIRTPTYTIGLDAGQDTTMTFKVRPANFNRNHRTVSLISHRPLSELEEQRFRFYAISEEAKQVDDKSVKRGTKVDFVKLANDKQVSPYSTENLPLVAEAQIQNLGSDFSFMSLNLQGIKQIDADRRLRYFTQLFYSQSFLSDQVFRNVPWYVGYFDKKWDVQVGQVNGRSIGLVAAGKGVTGSYQFHPNHRIGAHYVQSPGFFGAVRSRSFGVFHDYVSNGPIRVSSTLARSLDDQQNLNTTVASSRINTRLNKGHNLSLLLSGSLRSFTDTNVTQTGYLASATYSGIMVDKRLRVVLNGRYNNPTFGITTSERIGASNRTTFALKNNLELQLLNNFDRMNQFGSRLVDTVRFSFQNFINRLNLVKRTDLGTFQPGVFYDLQTQQLFTLHYRGVSFTYNNFNFKRNTLYTTTLRMGYNRAEQYPELGEYFSAQFSALLRVKTLTANLRYFYGPTNPLLLVNRADDNTYPQQFRTSLQHQYMFRNTRFILQSGANYSFNNLVKGHVVSLLPQLFYFTTTGWRFSVNVNYTFTSSNFQASTTQLNDIRTLEDPNPRPTQSNTMRVGATIRKEFGVPVPFTKKKNYDLDFTAFYDLNGNGLHDRDEPTIENVVIRISEHEVITNKRGQAGLKNIPKGNYGFIVIPLDRSEGWFPEISDSLFVNVDKPVAIPFVRGVKLFGNVVLDRDQRVTEEGDRFDLSNIKITASSDDKTYTTLTGFDGAFELYLPNGSYTVSFDNNVLTDRFLLVQNDIPVTLDRNLENIQVTFFIVEKRRKVKVKRFGQDR